MSRNLWENGKGRRATEEYSSRIPLEIGEEEMLDAEPFAEETAAEGVFSATRYRKFKKLIAGLIAALLLLYLSTSMCVSVGAGHAGVLWSRFGGGTVLQNTYSEGFHVILPWNRMEIYEMRFQEIHDDVSVLTQNGLAVSVTVAARFRPRAAHLPVLHQSAGPLYTQTIVWPVVLSSVREVVSKYKPEEIYAGEKQILEEAQSLAKKALQDRWIDLDGLVFTRVLLPERVQNAVQEKLAQEQKMLSYAYLIRQTESEKQRRMIEAAGIREFENRSRISFLKWKSIEATEMLAGSPNSKIIVLAPGTHVPPVALNGDK